MGTRRTSRKKFFNTPVHKRKELVRAPVAQEAGIDKKRDVVKTGDTVRVLRGDHKGKEGKVVKVDRKRVRIYIEGIQRKNSQGKDVYIPIHPSNVIIIKR
ncbi:MAG: 50S ribosomal protein L24 [Candidatus Micrarchaeota archaeon]|nr:50S ribosomal protein L24 [Candidatus Micrarchaeota archaeon]